jgi:hypothetical protein
MGADPFLTDPRCRLIVKLTPGQPYTREEEPGYPWDRRLSGSQTVVDVREERLNH